MAITVLLIAPVRMGAEGMATTTPTQIPMEMEAMAATTHTNIRSIRVTTERAAASRAEALSCQTLHTTAVLSFHREQMGKADID